MKKRIVTALFFLMGLTLAAPSRGVEVTFHVKEREVTRDSNRAFQNAPLSGWCMVKDKAGAHFLPVGTEVPGEESPSHFYFWDRFTLDLKPGVPYTVQVDKGFGWRPFEEVVELAKGQTEVTLYMNSWIALKNRRWLGGDLDARFIFMDPALAMDSQGLNLVCRVVTAASAVTDLEKRSVGFNHLSNERAFTGRDWDFGEFNVLGTLVDLVVEDETSFKSTDLYYLKKGKESAGYVDVVSPSGREVPVAAALGWTDFVRLVGPEEEVGEVWDEARALDRFESYYDLLNAGFRLSVSAGSRAAEREPVAADRIGASRVYARVKGAFSLGDFLEILKQGASWATNGPMVTLRVNGKDTGTEFSLAPPRKAVHISMGARSNHPLDRLELIHNGRVVETLIGSATEDYVLKDFVYDVTEPGWIAARVFEKPREGVAGIGYAHSSPAYLTLPETPAHKKEAVEKLAGQVENLLREVKGDESIDSVEKEHIVAWCGEALEVYRKRLAEFDPDPEAESR